MSERQDPVGGMRQRSSLNDLDNRMMGPPQLIHPGAHPELDAETPVEKIMRMVKHAFSPKADRPATAAPDPSVQGQAAEDAVMRKYVGQGSARRMAPRDTMKVATDRKSVK